MKISILIDPNLTGKINEIKSNLYANGFRIDNKTEIGKPHIKIAEAIDPNLNQKEQIENKIEKVFGEYKNNKIKNFELVNESRPESNWIALKIDEKWLKDLSHDIEGILDRYNINRTAEYKSKVFDIRKTGGENIKLEDCIADHLNLVNKCKSEKADEAFKQFEFLKDVKAIGVSGVWIEYE